jgi:hypothetical protein
MQSNPWAVITVEHLIGAPNPLVPVSVDPRVGWRSRWRSELSTRRPIRSGTPDSASPREY